MLLKSGQNLLPELGAAVFVCALDRDEVSVRFPQDENEEVVSKVEFLFMKIDLKQLAI